MKSEHRHELKTNELAQWIASFPQWTRQNLKTIIYVSVVVVLVAGAYIYKRYQKNVVAVKKEVDFTSLILQLPQRKLQILQSQAQGLDTSYNLLQIADYLQASGQNTNNDAMAALAFIKEGDVLRMELHYRLETVSQQDLQKQIEKAKSCYEQAVEKASESPSLSARAKYGLALCAEELGDFDQARQIYSDIAGNPQFEGTVVMAAAGHRLNAMTDYEEKVTFKQSQTPEEQTQILQPEIVVTPDDALPSLWRESNIETEPSESAPAPNLPGR